MSSGVRRTVASIRTGDLEEAVSANGATALLRTACCQDSGGVVMENSNAGRKTDVGFRAGCEAARMAWVQDSGEDIKVNGGEAERRGEDNSRLSTGKSLEAGSNKLLPDRTTIPLVVGGDRKDTRLRLPHNQGLRTGKNYVLVASLLHCKYRLTVETNGESSTHPLILYQPDDAFVTSVVHCKHHR